MEKDNAVEKPQQSAPKKFISKVRHTLFSSRKRIVILVIILLLIGFFVKTRVLSSSATPTYQTAQVEKGTLVVSVAESGQVSVANRTSVNTQASGVISEVDVKNGDTVTTGQKIAVVNLDQAGQQRQESAYASYLSAQSSLQSANAQLYTLQSSLFSNWQTYMNQATNNMYQNGDGSANTSNRVQTQFTVPQTQWLASQAQYQNQQGVINQAQANVSSNWLSYQQTSATITAPMAGTITDLVIAPGLQIGGSTSTSSTGSSGTSGSSGSSSGGSSQTIASIKTAGNPVINVSLSEVDAAKVKADQKATVTFDALPNLTFTGKVMGINTTGVVSSGVTTYPAIIQLDTPNDAILPNMSVTANIITDVADDVLLVPSAAVQGSGTNATVRVMKNGQITIVPVTIGKSSDTQTEITSGLSEGDTVVTGVTTPITGSASGTTSSGASPFSGTLRGGFGGAAGGGGAARGGGGAGGARAGGGG